jgi:hypothetical protein
MKITTRVKLVSNQGPLLYAFFRMSLTNEVLETLLRMFVQLALWAGRLSLLVLHCHLKPCEVEGTSSIRLKNTGGPKN